MIREKLKIHSAFGDDDGSAYSIESPSPPSHHDKKRK